MTALAKYSFNASDGQTSQAALGQEVNVKGATWVYTKANATIPAYSLCYILADGTMSLATPALLTTTKPTEVVIPQCDFASGDYGYAACGPFQLREDNVTTFKVLANAAAANVVLYGIAATPGTVDDAVVAPIIQGLTLSAAQAGASVATACQATRRLGTTS